MNCKKKFLDTLGPSILPHSAAFLGHKEMFQNFSARASGSRGIERIAELERSLARGEGRESSSSTAMAIAERAHARLGLLGNPSDIYGGKALAVSVANYAATVTLRANFDSKDETIHVVPGEGEREGGVKLIESLLSVFFDDPPLRHLRSERQTGFTLTYTSNIPYQVGLSGSSAIVCAALRCLVRYYEVEELIPRARLPNLVLEAETKLGIVAGYMDRVQQVSEGEEGGERARDEDGKTRDPEKRKPTLTLRRTHLLSLTRPAPFRPSRSTAAWSSWISTPGTLSLKVSVGTNGSTCRGYRGST